MRRKPGGHLSSEGIALARFVGGNLGDFDRVITSTLPRACETAVAMGYAIDRSVDALGAIPDRVVEATGWPADIPDIARSAKADREMLAFAETQAGIWRDVIGDLAGSGGRVLLISHGAIMELGFLAATGWGRVDQAGPVFGYCEGFRLTFDGTRFVSSEMARLPADRRLVAT